MPTKVKKVKKWEFGSHSGNLAYYQSLFERLSDGFVGTVTCDKISDDGCTLTFANEERGLVSTCNLRLLDFGDSAKDGIRLLEVIDPDEDVVIPVYVSQLSSAVIAVCVR